MVVTDPLAATVSGDISTQDADVLANTTDSGTATVTGSGGSGGYSYAFAAGATTSVAAGDFTIDANSGVVTFTQDAAYSHAPDSDLADNVYSIDVVITDSDGNRVTQTVTVDIADDTPVLTEDVDDNLTVLVTYDADGGVVHSPNASGIVDAIAAGADGWASVTISVLAYQLDSSGSRVLDGDGVPITLPLAGFTYSQASIDENGDTVFTASNADGVEAFTISLNVVSGAYSFDYLQPVAPTVVTTEVSLGA